MSHATGNCSNALRSSRKRCLLWAVLACCGSALLAQDTPQPPAASAVDPAAEPRGAGSSQRAYLIPVALPINGAVDTHVKRRVDQILADVPATGARPVLILEFRGRTGQSGEGSEFERCLSLARYLASDRLGRVRTIAWLPSHVKGHAVLPVIACEEIIVAPDAEFGQAGLNETQIGPTMRRGYSEIAEHRRTVPVAVVLGMLDKELAVYKAQTLDGVRYVLQDELKELQRTATVSSVESIIPPGDFGRFTGRDLRLKFGFASHLAADREELAAALQLPARSIEEDPSLGGAWTAIRVDVRGPIHAKAISWIERSVRQQLERSRANFLCVRLDSPGGSVTDSLRLASYLASLDSGEIRTVAYVESEARADASLIALACDHLVVGDDAILGGPGAVEIRPAELPEVRRAIQALAEAKHRDWSLWVALLDPGVAVRRYSREGTGEVRCFSAEELGAQSEPGVWQPGAEIDTRRGLLGREAEELRLARFLAGSLDELKQIYHLDEPLGALEPNWAHVLVERLSAPHIAAMLLFVAWFALLVEISHPGLSVAGFVSMLCFVVYFWSQFLHGTAGWLEVLLFAAGAISVLIEVFVIPGMGIFGLGGGLLIVAAIILASQTFVIPRNSYQLEQLPGSLLMVAAAGAGAFASMVIMRRYLADAPILKRLMLPPPEAEDIDELARREALADFEYLKGKRGRTTTQLTPSGKARFGDDVVDVISDGEMIPRGVDVYVAEVRGNCVAVQRIEAGEEC